MIIWVNGAFGSGKTSLVGELSRRWPAPLVFDPEQVGYLLTEIVDAPTGNFQDLPLWRRQVIDLTLGLLTDYERPILVPMTLVNAQYLEEIFRGLQAADVPVHHFFLKVSEETLIRRIDARTLHPHSPERDEKAKQWCKSQIASCTAAVDALPADTVVLDGERSLSNLADEVLTRLGRPETRE
ncbi:AAA family ATPase [Streptomyces sp. NBC_01643]|uniref:AAA family ATPase n=1 Tax=Streptomyces sp. NBC_01643 TaxID=2975906 RepID=UPI002F90FE49|nr:AAA family ATPase [Streptomyces sp. NBC_01643]